MAIAAAACPAASEWLEGAPSGPAREDAALAHAAPAPLFEAGRLLLHLGPDASPGTLFAPLAPWLRVEASRAIFPAAAPGDWRHGIVLLEIDSELPVDAQLALLRALPGVLSAQPNFVYQPDLAPSDPDYALQYAHALSGAESAWDLETGSPDAVIAVIGSGVELDHPDLAANLWENVDEIPGNDLDDDANGFVDDRHGWDFFDADGDPQPSGNAHETAVAGVAAAVGNSGQGIAGAAWNARLMPIRVAYTSADVAAAIDYAVENGARVLNMSFGNYATTKYGTDSVVELAVDAAHAAGVVSIATAGNDSTSTLRYPAALEHVIAVAATDAQDRRATFSNYGAWIDVAAPGDDIHSTTTGGAYAEVSGTSFAAPYVSGLAALLLSANPALSPESVRDRIRYSVDKLASDQAIGTGRVRMDRALQLQSDPVLFALIQSPRPDQTFPALLSIEGIALGDSYVLEHRRVGLVSWTAFASGSQGEGVLGSLDTTLLASGHYDVRLRSQQGGDADTHVVRGLVLESTSLVAGWPRSIGPSGLSSATPADLDGDGDLELIAASSEGVHAWHDDGTPVSGWPVTGGGTLIRGAPSVGDIDGDGDLEVLKLDAAGDLRAWSHDGSALPAFERDLGNQSRSAAVLGDVDGDGVAEVITSVYGYGPARVDVLAGDGSSLPGWPAALENNQQSSPTLADLDGDGLPEIVVHGYTTLYAFHGNGAPVAGFPVALPGSHTSPVALDVDGDGDHELIAFTRYDLYLFEGDGQGSWLASLLAGSFGYATPALGDVDGDGDFEVCIGDEQGNVHLFSTTSGASPAGWPVAVGGESSCSIADVDADGAQEVLIASEDAQLHAFEADGSALAGSWPKALGAAIHSSPSVSDLDEDGELELAAITLDGELWVLRFSESAGSSAAHWPTYQSGPEHQGVLLLPEPGRVAMLVLGGALIAALSRRRRGVRLG